MSIDEELRFELATRAAATEARLSDAQTENDELRAEAAQLRAELAARAAQLADVHASTSWRLSAPVRVVGSMLRSARSGRVRREAVRLARLLAPGLMQRHARSQSAPLPAAGRPDLHSDPLLLAAEAGRLEYRPTISILVPVYDTAPRYLRLAVDSVVAQAYPEWELILCDDGSTKADTRAALEEIAKLDSRIRVHVLGVNRGIAAATNAALAMAQGEFVAMLDHDDELMPAALLEVVKSLNADRTLDVIYTDEDQVEADGAAAATFYNQIGRSSYYAAPCTSGICSWSGAPSPTRPAVSTRHSTTCRTSSSCCVWQRGRRSASRMSPRSSITVARSPATWPPAGAKRGTSSRSRPPRSTVTWSGVASRRSRARTRR